MQPWRVGIACGVIGLIFLGSATDILLLQEHWPFSHYPMFSGIQDSDELESDCIYGITKDGEEIDAQTLFPPFDTARLRSVLHLQIANGTLQQMSKSLLSLHHRASSSLQFVGIRLYKCHWALDNMASNASDPERILLFEYFLEN
jgi:hypothetical protein